MSFLHSPALRSENTTNIVTIDLSNHPPNAKLGMLLAPGSLPTPLNNSSDNNGNNVSSSPAAATAAIPTASNVTLVAGWEHGTNQPLGPIQRSGMVRLGDRLVRINGRDVTDWTFREVMDVLKEMITTTNNNTVASSTRRKKRLTTLGFAPSGSEEWSKGVIVGGEEFNSTSILFGLFQSQESKVSPHVISKRLYSFVSFVGRWRVVDEPTVAAAVDTLQGTKCNDSVKEVEHQQQNESQQQQQRQISENSTDLLEEQLNKEPSMKFDDSDDAVEAPEHDTHDEITNDDNKSPKEATAAAATPSIFSSEAEAEWHKEINEFQQNNPPPTKKIVQYEIQCHLLLRHDPNSNNTTSHSHHHYHGIRNKNTIHHTWSIWKRYSEFQSLDTELRNTFGWQMDAMDDGKGIVFPSMHGLESWWYGWRNGGGYLTSLMGGSYGVDARREVVVEEEEADNTANEKEKTTSNNDPSISSSATTTTNTNTCPYPKPFIEKRQKELSSYWISLSRVEDIFEFSDVNSHRFGALMASFLEVDQILLSRRSNNRNTTTTGTTAGNQQRYAQPTSPSRLTVPVIHENETELYSFGARKSEQWLSSPPSRDFSGITFNDDDVSMLSDGTGYLTSLQNNYSPVGGGPVRRLLVDNVPAQFTSNNPPPLTPAGVESRSVSSKSARQAGGRKGASRKAKPAFQRQLIE